MYGHVTWVPDPHLSAANARALCLAALLFSAALVALPLLAWAAWCLLRAGWRNWQAMWVDDDTQDLPAVEDIPQRGGIYIPPDPIAQHADGIAEWAGPTYQYPVITVITAAEWDTTVHQFNADYDAWRRTS